MCPRSQAMTATAFVGKQNPDCSLALVHVSADESRCQATGSNSLLLLFFHYLPFSPSSKGNTLGPHPRHLPPNKYLSSCVRQVWHQLLEGKKKHIFLLELSIAARNLLSGFKLQSELDSSGPTPNFVDESINGAQVPRLPYVGHVWMSLLLFSLPPALAALHTYPPKCVKNKK